MKDAAAHSSISELAGALRRREFSSVELTRLVLDRIASNDGAIGAFLTTTRELAMQQAVEADRRLAIGEGGPLMGIPMALKDILSTKGITTTCGSRILEDYVPQYDATVVRKLFDAGAVLVGKTNMDEFAMGSSNENSAFKPVHNPWDLARVPGGSSGGSAAAVAGGEAVYALGTDTGGSIRQPAALTGTVGLKPTYGRVSRYGLIAFASSLDQIGPITRTVGDAALVLSAIGGYDVYDSTSLQDPVPAYSDYLNGNVDGMRIGLPREYFSGGMDPGVAQAVENAVKMFTHLGVELVDVSLPHTDYALSTYYVLSPAEAMANLARYDGVRYGLSIPGEDVWEMFATTRQSGFGAEVKRRILLGAYVLSAGYYDAYYLQAQKVRTRVRQDFEEVFAGVDALLTPTTPTPAFLLGEKVSDPLQMYLNDVYTVPANIAGICGLSVPAGFVNGLPVGVQLLGPSLGEIAVLRLGHAFEEATQFHLSHPDSTGGEYLSDEVTEAV